MSTSTTFEVKGRGRNIYFETTVSTGSWATLDKDITIDEWLVKNIVVTADGQPLEVYMAISPQFLPAKKLGASNVVIWGLMLHDPVEKDRAISVTIPAGLISDGVVVSDAETISTGNNYSVFYPLSTNTRFNDVDRHIGPSCPIAYVDYANGDDGTGQTYIRSDAPINETPTNPSGVGSVLAYKTTNAARVALMGSGFGVHKHAAILVLRGSDSRIAGQGSSRYFDFNSNGGVSRDAMLIVASYGNASDPNPRFQLGAGLSQGVALFSSTSQYHLFSCLDFYNDVGDSTSTIAYYFTPPFSGASANAPCVYVDGGRADRLTSNNALLNGANTYGFDDITFANLANVDNPSDSGLFGDGGDPLNPRFNYVHYDHCAQIETGGSDKDHGHYMKAIPYTTEYRGVFYTAQTAGAGFKADHMSVGMTAQSIFQCATGHNLENNGGYVNYGVSVDRSDTRFAGAEILGFAIVDCVFETSFSQSFRTVSTVDCLIRNCFTHGRGTSSASLYISNTSSSFGTADNKLRDGYRFWMDQCTCTGDGQHLTQIELPVTDDRSGADQGVIGIHQSGVKNTICLQRSAATNIVNIKSTANETYNAAAGLGRIDYAWKNLNLFSQAGPVAIQDGDGSLYTVADFGINVSSALGIVEEDPGFVNAGYSISDYQAELGYGSDRAYWDAYIADLLDITKESSTRFTTPAIADAVAAANTPTLLDPADYGGIVPGAVNWSAAFLPPTAVLGYSVGGVAVVDGGQVDLGASIVFGADTHVDVLIANTGTGDATLGTVMAGGHLSIDPGADPSNTVIAAGGSVTLGLVVNTATAGAVSGTLSVPSDDANSPFDLTVIGTVLDEVVVDTHNDTGIRTAYLNIAEADAILTQHLMSVETEMQAWTSLADADKDLCLALATGDIDAVAWVGHRADKDQGNAWPRINRWDEIIMPGGEAAVPAAVAQDEWSFAGLPSEIRIGVALQAAGHAARALGLDDDAKHLGRARRGITGVSGGGRGVIVNRMVADRAKSQLAANARQFAGRYIRRTVGAL